MNKSYLIAGSVALAAAGWILSGQVGDRERSAYATGNRNTGAVAEPLKQVRVRTIAAKP